MSGDKNLVKTDDYNEYLKKLKLDFDKKWVVTQPSVHQTLETSYEQIRIVGEGSFGKVVLCCDKNQKDNYVAVKVVKKKKIVESKLVQQIINEKRVLECVEFPFLIYLLFSLKDNDFLYFGMPFVAGGDLYTCLKRAKKFPENVAKFYAAQVCMGLEYLHHINLIYRDLKPDNMLLDYKGYVKITDFGFTKRVPTRTLTLCGTPEYIAPEIILTKPYGTSVDWWAFGIVIYEFVDGRTPFYQFIDDPIHMYTKICEGDYHIPTNFSPELKHLVMNLLQLDVTKRYGNLKNGVADIKSNAWFKKIEWYKLYNQDIVAPYVPEPKIPKRPVTKNHPVVDIPKSKEDKFKEEFADF